MKNEKTAIELIADERKRQIERLNYQPTMDIRYFDGQLAQVASTYAMPEHERSTTVGIPDSYPEDWDDKFWKPSPNDRVKELVKAGALICAEIDRLKQMEGFTFMLNRLPEPQTECIVALENGHFANAFYHSDDMGFVFETSHDYMIDVVAYKKVQS